MAFAILGILFQFLFLGAIIFGVVKLFSRRGGERSAEEAPIGVKQFLQYGSLYAAVHVAAWGVAGVISLIREDRVADNAGTPLALTVVGVPIVFFLGRWVWRSLSDPFERDAVFGLYVNVTVVTALIAVMVSAGILGHWLVGGGDYNGQAVGTLVAWAPVWGVHWWLWRTYRSDVSNLHVYVGSAAGLGTAAVFGGILIGYLMIRLLESGTDLTLTSIDDPEIGTWLVGLTVGAVVFAWYWVGTGMKEIRDTLWHAYVVLVGVLGGLIISVVGAGVGLFGILQWWVGDPGQDSAVRHFEDFVPAAAALVVGLAVWWYHRRVLGPTRGARAEVQRVYDYAVAAVGLVTAIVGVVILVIGFQEAVFPPADSMTSEVDILLGAITTLAVGVPLWAQAWMRTNRYIIAGPAEAASPTRRSYLFAVMGTSGVAAAISLLVLLVTVFNDLLGEAGGRLRDDIQVPVALLATVGAVAVYHLLVFREEKTEPVAVERPKQVLLVTADVGLAAAVGDLTGARVRVIHRLDADGPADVGAIAEAVGASSAEHLLVVPAGDGSAQVIPYQP